jgi:hypothetical protein
MTYVNFFKPQRGEVITMGRSPMFNAPILHGLALKGRDQFHRMHSYDLLS